MGGPLDDCDAFTRKYNCRMWLVFGSTLGAAIIAGLTWFVIEYRNQQLGIAAAEAMAQSTQKALDAHTQQEREHYDDTMAVMGEVEKSVQGLTTAVTMLNFQLNGGPIVIPPAAAIPRQPPMVARHHQGETTP